MHIPRAALVLTTIQNLPNVSNCVKSCEKFSYKLNNSIQKVWLTIFKGSSFTPLQSAEKNIMCCVKFRCFLRQACNRCMYKSFKKSHIFNHLCYMQRKKICFKLREIGQLSTAHAKSANTAKNASNVYLYIATRSIGRHLVSLGLSTGQDNWECVVLCLWQKTSPHGPSLHPGV